MRLAVALALLALPSVGPHPAWSQQLPAPTGPAGVGTVWYEWVDSARAEVVELGAWDSTSRKLTRLPARGHRRVAVQLWYPAASGAPGSFAPAPYNPDLEAFAPAIGDSARVALYRRTTTHAALRAPPVGERLPVLLFSPGGGTFRADYTALCEDLASHGYVVVAVSHLGIGLVSLGDGSIGTEWAGWRPPPGMSMSLQRDSLRASTEFFARTRDSYAVADLRFVLDRLRDLDAGAEDRRFAGRLDLAHIGAFGHSTGGAVVAAAARADSRIRAVLVYDVILPGLLFGENLTVPLMLFRTDDKRYPAGWHDLQAETFRHVSAPGYDVILRGGGHNSFSDRAVLSPSRYPYTLDAGQAIELIRLYSRAFFDAHVRDRGGELLRTGMDHREISLTVHLPR